MPTSARPSRVSQRPPARRASGRNVADLWLGRQVRSLRKAKGMSIQQLAERASLSIGMVSQIERCMASPSIRSLRGISEALGVPISWFFHEAAVADQEELGIIVRRNHRRLLRLPTNGVSKELLTPDLSGELEVLLATIEPGGTSGPELYTHEGEEAGYVIKGALNLWIKDRLYRLEEGDAFRFASTTPHRFENAADSQTQVLWVISPPLY